MKPGLHHPHSRPSSGFVLIEVLVALAVFAIGIVAVLTSVLSTLDLQKESAQRHRAGLLLEEKLAETAMLPFHGEPQRGHSADGVFNWSIHAEPWPGAAQLMKDQPDPDAPEPVEKSLFEVVVDIRWESTKGTRSLQARQLKHISLGDEEEQP